MGLGSPVAKGRTPPPLQLSGLLDASETATAYAVAQKRVTTEYLHSPLVMHKVSEGVDRVLFRKPKGIFPPHTHLCLGGSDCIGSGSCCCCCVELLWHTDGEVGQSFVVGLQM